MIKVNQSVHFRALGTIYKVLNEWVGGSAAVVEHTLGKEHWSAQAQAYPRK